jgi:hypothetical protein
MPTTIDSAGITFNDATTLTSALIPTTSLTGTIAGTQIADGAVTAVKLGTDEQKQIAKAWVNFDGTTSPGTIRSSYNVSSVTKNGVGDYTVNFATAMTDANYSVVSTGNDDLNNTTFRSTNNLSQFNTANVCRISSKAVNSGNEIFLDAAYINLAIFGN